MISWRTDNKNIIDYIRILKIDDIRVGDILAYTGPDLKYYGNPCLVVGTRFCNSNKIAVFCYNEDGSLPMHNLEHSLKVADFRNFSYFNGYVGESKIS